MKAEKVRDQIQKYISALQQIAALPKAHTGRTDEEEFDDMEDAYGNGLEAGEYSALQHCAAIAKDALR